MSTNAYAAKRALFARLGELAVSGGPLDGVQVAYAYPAAPGMELVYGGGVTFEQPGDDDAHDGVRRLVAETATVGVHVRVSISPPPPAGIADADVRCEEIGEAIGALLTGNPRLAGGASVTEIVGGQGDYSSHDDAVVSTLSYRVRVKSHFEQ